MLLSLLNSWYFATSPPSLSHLFLPASLFRHPFPPFSASPLLPFFSCVVAESVQQCNAPHLVFSFTPAVVLLYLAILTISVSQTPKGGMGGGVALS